MTTKLISLALVAVLAACGAKASQTPATEPAEQVEAVATSCDEPLPAPAPAPVAKPSFDSLGEGSCSK